MSLRFQVSGLRFPALLVLALVLVLDLRAEAQGRATSVTLGKGWAIVCDERVLTFTNRTQDFVLDGIPAEADLNTFSVLGRRVPISMPAWSPVNGAKASPAPIDTSLAISTNRRDVVWHAGPPAAAADRDLTRESRRIWCRLEAPSTGDRPVEVVYFVTGMTWNAGYSVLLRGDLTNEEEKVAVEFNGVIRIQNTTGCSLSGALVRLVGEDVSPDQVRPNEPGFLMLEEDSPLSDIWRQPASDNAVAHDYALREPADIAPRGQTIVPLATAARQPAERIYKLASGDLPVEGRQQARPLHKYLVLRNNPASGLGFALPPGDADVFLGSGRSALLQSAWFSHTPANGEIRIDLGLATRVLASRSFAGRDNESLGAYNATYNLVLENQLTSPVWVEIDEKPPTSLAWELVRSKVTCTQRGRELMFTTLVEGRSTQRIDYTIRVHEPTQ